MKIRLHAFEPSSRANGPGLRAVVWVQGCTLGCPGCFNPSTHNLRDGYESDTMRLAAEILALGERIEGVSISGGEPFQQPEALVELLQQLKDSHLSRLVFTGYALDEIRDQRMGPAIIDQIDVLIAGRYDRSLPARQSLLGSRNQRIHCLTNRYELDELTTGPRSELILRPDGSIAATGMIDWRAPRSCSPPDGDSNASW